MPGEMSNDTSHKLHAALYHESPTAEGFFLSGYRRALERWFIGLSPDDQHATKVARAAFDRGNDAGALKIAACLPSAPTCPLL